MKKIIFALLMALITLVGNSQDRTMGTWSFGYESQYLYYLGLVNDTVGGTKDSLAAIFTMNKTYPTRYDGKVVLDSLGTAGRIAVKLQGRKFVTDTWTDITTVNYYSTDDDTAIYFSLNTEESSTTTGSRVIVYDTTKIMNHAVPSLQSLYYGTETGTYTTVGTGVAKYWYEYRLLIRKTAGRSKLKYFEFRFIE